VNARRERFLVAGAAGFVGSWLCRRLVDDGQDVIALVRKKPPPDGLFAKLNLFGQVDVYQLGNGPLATQLASIAPDKIINLAGQSQVRSDMGHVAPTFVANTAFLWELLDACRAAGIKASVVQASSAAVYGGSMVTPANEDTALCATGPYEASKAAAEIVTRSFAATYDLPVVVARLSNVYGPGDPNRNRLIPDIMGALRAGRRPELRGGGRSIRDYLYVDDAIDAILLLAQHVQEKGIRGEVFNIASGDSYATLEVAHLACKICRQENVEPLVKDENPHETSVIRCSTEKILHKLGWRARITLPEGLERLVNSPYEANA
jgi:CDP-glucose 4,6-dehydratase